MQYKWIVLTNTSLATLMTSLDNLIVLIALPTIAKELPQTSVFDLLWILLGYQLITASVLVNFGRLSDMFGRVRLYTMGFALLTLGSVLCSLSETGNELVVFRIVQALGASLIFSNTAALVTDAFPPEERGRALGINQVTLVGGSSLGLVMGGVLTSTVGWRSVFWINIPIGLFATAWGYYKLRPTASGRASSERIDVWGNLTLVASISLILASISLFTFGDLTATYAAMGVLSGTILLPVFALLEMRAPYPMLDLSLFRIRSFNAGNIAIFLNGLARGTTSLVLTFYLQGPTMNLRPYLAGVFLLPLSASIAFAGPIGGWLSDRLGARLVTSAGIVVIAAGFVIMTQIGEIVTFAQLALPLVLVGGGLGVFLPANTSSILSSVPPERRGVASGTNTTLHNLGQTFSTAMTFFIMTATLPAAYVGQVFGSGAAAPSTGAEGVDLILAMHRIYYIAIVLLIMSLIPSMMRGKTPGGFRASDKAMLE